MQCFDVRQSKERLIKEVRGRTPSRETSAALSYYYSIKGFNIENEDDLMQSKDDDDGGLTPA